MIWKIVQQKNFICGIASLTIHQILWENKCFDLQLEHDQVSALDLARRKNEAYISSTLFPVVVILKSVKVTLLVMATKMILETSENQLLLQIITQGMLTGRHVSFAVMCLIIEEWIVEHIIYTWVLWRSYVVICCSRRNF